MRASSRARNLLARLEAARLRSPVRAYNESELEGLPAPVERYFRAVLNPGQPVIEAAGIEQSGSFNMSATGEKWRPFTAIQRVVTRRPGFVWDARIAFIPGVSIRVHDAYVVGEGILRATLLGLLTLADLRGTRDIAEGELMRFLAETAWYPTALLPSQGVRWESVDDRSANATLTDGDIGLTMLFRFDEHGLIDSVHAGARGRTVGKTVIPTPWEGRWRRYEVRHGMRIPLEGEVAWMLPQGPRPYWRGRIRSLRYEFPT